MQAHVPVHRTGDTAVSDWGQPAAAGSGYQASDPWGAPSAVPAAGAGGWQNGVWPGASDENVVFQPVAPNSTLPLYVALGVSMVGLAAGLLLHHGWFLILSWWASGLLPVALLAVYQVKDLRAATSMWYVPNSSATVLRVAILACGVLGVLVNTFFFAHWLAAQ